MSRGSQKPTVMNTSDSTYCEQRHDHPAFGVVKLAKVHSSHANTLFGSNVDHHEMIRIDVERAHLNRHLHRDWIHSDEKLVSFYMTFAQWAQFVSSIGDGTGTQITLDSYFTDNRVLPPSIERVETVRDTFKREIKEKAAKYALEASSLYDQLNDLVESGKANKTQLKRLLDMAHQLKNNMPGNMAFIQSSLEETMEKTVEACKSDIEGFVMRKITEAGLESIMGSAPKVIELGGEDE